MYQDCVIGVMAAPSITVTVHRGSKEIGGNCVEAATGKSRLILDVGMPLSEMMVEGASKRRNSRHIPPPFGFFLSLNQALPNTFRRCIILY